MLDYQPEQERYLNESDFLRRTLGRSLDRQNLSHFHREQMVFPQRRDRRLHRDAKTWRLKQYSLVYPDNPSTPAGRARPSALRGAVASRVRSLTVSS